MSTAQAVFVVVLALIAGAALALVFASDPSREVFLDAVSDIVAFVMVALVFGLFVWALVSAYVSLG